MAANKNFWTEAETAFLKQHYPTMPTRQLAALMNRPYATIKDKATVLKVKKELLSLSPWTPEKVKQLIELYPNTTNAELVKLLDLKSEAQIDAKAFKLKLKKSAEFKTYWGKQSGYKPGQKPPNTGNKQKPQP